MNSPRERHQASPEVCPCQPWEGAAALCFPSLADRPRLPLPSMLTWPEPDPWAEFTSHCFTTWGLGKCLYFGMSQKYIFVQSGKIGVSFFAEGMGSGEGLEPVGALALR